MDPRRGRLGNTPLGNRPVTLGELLFREENNIQDMRPPPARPMGRIMSPTRRLGPLANGRPRRPRGRTLTRQSASTSTVTTATVTSTTTSTDTPTSMATSESTDTPTSTATSACINTPTSTAASVDTMTSTDASTSNINAGEESSQQSQPPRRQRRRRRRATTTPTLRSLARWRNARAEARIQNFYGLVNGSRTARRRRNSRSSNNRGGRHSVVGRSDSPDLFFNPFGWRRSHSHSTHRHARSRSVTSSGSRSGQQGQSQRVRLTANRPAQTSSGNRMIDVDESRAAHRVSPSGASTRYLRSSGLRRSSRRSGSGSSTSELPASVRQFIDFAAEFIPVEPPAPDAEPPEWSLNITAADLGPFAVGRSALSRARSLAVMGVLSQVSEEFNSNDTNNEQPNPNANENS